MQTPTRRPYAATARRLIDDGDGTPWKATRCQRLLRSLVSGVATLRKKHDRYQCGDIVKDEKSVAKQSHQEPALGKGRFKCVAQCLRGQEEEADPEWAPGKPTKPRRKYTYSTRGALGWPQRTASRDRTTRTNEGHTHALVTATPRISTSKMLKAISTPTADGQPPSSGPGPPEISRAPPKRQRFASHSHEEILRGVEPVCDSLESSLSSLLLVTQAVSTMPAKKERAGTRSLFATCLSKVPRYIIDAQAYIEEDDEEDDRDMTDEVYSDLEALSLNPSAGWQPLREVVRAHGIAILADAIRDLLIPFPRASKWAFDCARKGFVDEGQKLWEAILESSIERKDVFNATKGGMDRILFELQTFANFNDRENLVWPFLVHALESQCLNLAWFMDPRQQYLWAKIMNPLLVPSRRESTEGAQCLLTMLFSWGIGGTCSNISSAVQRLRVKSNQRQASRLTQPLKLDRQLLVDDKVTLRPMPYMFLSILEALLTIIILRPTSGNPASGVLQGIVRHISILQEILPMQCLSEFNTCIHLLSDLAITLLGAFEDVNIVPGARDRTRKLLFRDSNISEQTFDVLARLVATVAEHTTENVSSDLNENLEAMTRHLLHLSQSGGTQTLGRVAVLAAFDFAERNPRKAHLDFALELEDELDDLVVQRNDVGNRTPPKSKETQRCFRWEESISEWVAKTPLPAASKVVNKVTTSFEHFRPRALLTPPPEDSQQRATECHRMSQRSRGGRFSRAGGSGHITETESQNEADGSQDDVEDTEGPPRHSSTRRLMSTDISEASSSPHREAFHLSVRTTRPRDLPLRNQTPQHRMLPSVVIPAVATAHCPRHQQHVLPRVVIPAVSKVRGEALQHQILPQVIVPAASTALKRCVSEPSLHAAPAAKRQKRSRLSNESGTTFYKRDGEKVLNRRASERLTSKPRHVMFDDGSEDELGM